MLNIDPQKTSRKIQVFIRSAVKGEGYKNVLIGVSGGVDSAASLALAVRAMGHGHVFPVLMPYGKLNDGGSQDAMLAIKALKIPSRQINIVNIKPFVDSVVKYDPKMDDLRRGNIMARMRMIVLYDLSKKLNALVIGTENRTEHLLGYYTRFGDEASDIEPIKELYKTEVYQLAEYLDIPEKILIKSPTAGLWQGQTDEKEFGFPYKTADEILYLRHDKKLSKSKITAKYGKKIVDRIWWWMEKGEFKDRVPYDLSR